MLMMPDRGDEDIEPERSFLQDVAPKQRLVISNVHTIGLPQDLMVALVSMLTSRTISNFTNFKQIRLFYYQRMSRRKL